MYSTSVTLAAVPKYTGLNCLRTLLDRLHTIIDFDRVLVLGQGEVLEYDTPSVLLDKEDSEFYKLCKESGDLDRLREIARVHEAEK